MYYSKVMPDGKIIPRLEQIQTPNQPLEQVLEMMKKQLCTARNFTFYA